jgi:hypothetical protein
MFIFFLIRRIRSCAISRSTTEFENCHCNKIQSKGIKIHIYPLQIEQLPKFRQLNKYSSEIPISEKGFHFKIIYFKPLQPPPLYTSEKPLFSNMLFAAALLAPLAQQVITGLFLLIFPNFD